MLDKIKQSLRIDVYDFDDELIDLIEGCKADLKISGVSKIDDTDSLIIRAITIYCKIHFGYANENYEKLSKSYDMLKSHLSLCVEYSGVI